MDVHSHIYRIDVNLHFGTVASFMIRVLFIPSLEDAKMCLISAVSIHLSAQHIMTDLINLAHDIETESPFTTLICDTKLKYEYAF